MNGAQAARLRLCLFGAAPAQAWLQSVREEAVNAALVLFGDCAQAATGDDVPLADIRDASVHAILREAAARFPGAHLILLRSGTALPRFWYRRLRRALDVDDVLVAGPLDNLHPSRAPLPAGARSALAPARVDELCYAYGRSELIDASNFSPLLSAWHGERLARVNLLRIEAGALPQTLAPLRGVLLDHLYVADPERALQGPAAPMPGADEAPPSPLGELRENIALALATSPNRPRRHDRYLGLDGAPVVLHVLHGWGGGAERFVRDLVDADEHRHHLVLMALGNFDRRRYGERLELRDGSLSRPALREIDLPDAIASTSFGNRIYAQFLETILRDYSVDAIVVSSLIGHSLDVLRTALPTVYFVHDFYPLWPLLHRNLDDPDTVFDAAQLRADLAKADAGFEFAERSADYWLDLREAAAEAFLAADAHLVAPSRAALALFLGLQPRLKSLQQTVIAHGIAAWSVATPALPPPPQRDRLRLIVLGRVRRGKAAHLLRQLLPEISAHAELFLLGAGPESEEFFGRRDVHILLNYRRDDLPELLARVAADAALILPNFAETFSYTLSELGSLGIPVIATRLGALAERIQDGTDGFLVAPAAADVLALIARLHADRAALLRVRSHLAQRPVRTLADMAADYRALLPLVASASQVPTPNAAMPDRLTAAVRAAQLGDAHRIEVRLRADLAAQHRELLRRGEWGMGLDRELKAAHALIVERTQWAQAAAERESATRDELARFAQSHARLEREFDERSRWALSLDSQLRETHASTSWRITRPLRYAMRALRSARARSGYLLRRLRSAAARTRGSLGQRGLIGTLRRIALELRRARSGAPVPAPIAVAPVASDAPFQPFGVPRSATPRVSIVIPVYNKFEYTEACLRSLAEHADAIGFETIVVDDNSSDVTAERLALIDGIRPLRNESNRGFIGSCNAGAALAAGEFVLFLNNDTVVTPGWLHALVTCFTQEPDAGLVGAKLVYPDGRLQEAGGIVFRDGSGWNYGRFDDPADPRYEFRREADYCSGAAIMLPRSLFEQLGGFDTRYAPAYYEDTDLAFAVRAQGRKVFYEPRAVVVHFEGITSGTDTASGIKKYQIVNRGAFFEKWKHELARLPKPIDEAQLAPAAATFRARQRALIVDAYTPTPDQDSGSLRMTNLMRLLRELHWHVSFLPDNRAHAGNYTRALQALGVEALYHPYVADPAAWLRTNGKTLDAVILSRHYVASNYIGLVRLYAPQARLIFDTVDLHYLREQRSAALANRPELARQAAATRENELKLMRECDLTLVVSPVEKALLAREVPHVRVDVLSNVHEIYGARHGFAQRRDLVFVGSFQHPPNVDAMLWFVGEVFPLVRKASPGICLHIIGNKAPASVLDLAADDIVVHGYVEDIAPFMDGCRLSVAPLRVGAGVKGKVNMAMSYGLPVVATATAVEGMHVRAGEDVLVADTPADFADAVVRAYHDESLWNSLSANGLVNVHTHFSFDAARAALARILPS